MTTLARFRNKYGETQQIHRTRHGLRVVREPTPLLQENAIVSRLVKARIGALRRKAGWTLAEAGVRYGMASGNPKARAWAMENVITTRNTEGMRLGTIYRVAAALGVPVTALLPTDAEVSAALMRAP